MTTIKTTRKCSSPLTSSIVIELIFIAHETETQLLMTIRIEFKSLRA